MGKSSGGSDSADKANALLQEQLDLAKQQTAFKLQSLQSNAMNVLKSQGGLNWNAKAPSNDDFLAMQQQVSGSDVNPAPAPNPIPTPKPTPERRVFPYVI